MSDDWLARGWTVLPAVASDDEAAALAVAVARHVPPLATDTAHGRLRHDCRAQVSELDALARDGRLADVALRLTGLPEVTLFQDVLVWKTPGASEPLPWHRDCAYWPLDGDRGAVLWLALDDADPDNGCVVVVDGSHVETDSVGDAAGDAAAASVATDRAHPVPVRRGDLLVLHPRLRHASGPNSSSRDRRAWITTWIDPALRWAPDRAHHPWNYLVAPEPGSAVTGDRFPRFRARTQGAR